MHRLVGQPGTNVSFEQLNEKPWAINVPEKKTKNPTVIGRLSSCSFIIGLKFTWINKGAGKRDKLVK
jgi:hypothetical protein